jgi:hypothetical protein
LPGLLIWFYSGFSLEKAKENTGLSEQS